MNKKYYENIINNISKEFTHKVNIIDLIERQNDFGEKIIISKNKKNIWAKLLNQQNKYQDISHQLIIRYDAKLLSMKAIINYKNRNFNIKNYFDPLETEEILVINLKEVI